MHSQTARLVHDLHAVARRGVSRVYDEHLAPLDIAELNGVLDAIRPIEEDECGIDQLRTRLELILESVIETLPTAATPQTERGLQWVATQLFSPTRDVDGREGGKFYDNRIRSIREQDNRASATRIDRLTLVVRTSMAATLLNWRARADNSHTSFSLGSDVVPRVELERKLERMFASGARIIVLHGDVGTGKSTLALASARKRAANAESIFTLNCQHDDDVAAGLMDLFATDLNTDVGEASTPALSRRFALSLVAPSEPGRVVVLDNLQSERQARLLLPNRPAERVRIPVLMTSNYKLLEGIPGVQHLRVENATPEEGAAMVLKRLPDLSASDAEALSLEMEQRPLGIAHASALLQTMRPRPSITDFRNMLHYDLVGLIDSVPGEQKLTSIYRRLLTELRTRDEYAAATRVLEMLLFLGEYTPERVVVKAWHPEGSKNRELRQAVDTYIVAEASELLERIGIITLADRSDTRVLQMHRLTRLILNTLWSAAYDTTFETFVAGFADFLAEIEWDSSSAVAPENNCSIVHFVMPFRDVVIRQRALPNELTETLARWTGPVICAADFEKTRDGEALVPLEDLLMALVRARNPAYRSTNEHFRAVRAGLETGLLVDYVLRVQVEAGFGGSLASTVSAVDHYGGEYPALTPFTLEMAFNIDSDGVCADYSASVKTELTDLLTSADRAAHMGRWSHANKLLERALERRSPSTRFNGWEADIARRGLRIAIQSGLRELVDNWRARAEACLSEPEGISGVLASMRLSNALQVANFDQTTRGMEGMPAADVADALGRIQYWYFRSAEQYSQNAWRNIERLFHYDASRIGSFLSPCVGAHSLGIFHMGGDGERHPANSQGIHPICTINLVEEAKLLIPHWLVHKARSENGMAQEIARQANWMLNIAQGGASAKSGPLSVYQRLDAAVVGLSLALFLADRPSKTFRALRELASRLADAAGRPDRVALAQRVGAGEVEFPWLHAW